MWSRGAHSHRIGRARPASFMTMADVSAPSAPAAGQQEGAQPTWGETLSRIVRSALMYVLVMQVFGGFQPGAKQTIDAGASSGNDVARGPVARRISSPMFSRGEPLDFYAYITRSPDFDSHGDLDALVEIDTGVPLCGVAKSPGTATETSPGTEDTGEREYSIVHSLHPEDLQRNATPHLHVFFARSGKPHDPRDERYDPEDVFGASTPLFRFYPKPKKRAARKNLLSGETTDVPGDGDGDGDAAFGWLPFFKPNVTVSLVDDFTTYPYPNGMPPAMREKMNFAENSDEYYPTVWMNEFWLLRDHLVPVNESLPAVNLTLVVAPLSLWKWQVMEQMDRSFAQQRAMGTAGENDADELKRVLLEGNPVLLVVTGAVSLLHTVFDMLAFKNDVGFWRQNKSMEGLSARTVVFNAVCQAIIFLYLLDNDTSWMVLLSSGLGLGIEAWKITKCMDVRVTAEFPFVALGDKHGYAKSDTAKHDEVAMRYLSYALYPLVGCYAVYSVAYNEHKSWYSFVLNTLVGAVYMFGFITMCPQLYINYKLKSVAHLPWRQMTYKFLNTVIDDLFAFVIKMPTLHRLSVFRDDVVFAVALYQRWIYRVDTSRINEFGFSGEDPFAGAGEGVERVGVSEGEEREEQSREETKKDK